MTASCSICAKHADLAASTGPVIAEEGGLWLTHFPVQDGADPVRGYLLVEPLRCIRDMSEMDEGEARAFGALVARGEKLIKQRLGAEHVYLFRINDAVAHLHFHLVPRYPGTPKEFWGLRIREYPDAPRVNLSEIRRLAFELG